MTDHYKSRASTHAPDCWSWGPTHYECAVREIERLQAEVEKLQEVVRPKREEECLTLDHWRMRAYSLEESWSRCSRACAIEQGKREQAEARAAKLEEALRLALVDAERYRLLRKGAIEDVAVVRGLGAMDYGMSAVISTYAEEIDGDDLDTAIDAAMLRDEGGEQ